jgi:hypothetical protein
MSRDFQEVGEAGRLFGRYVSNDVVNVPCFSILNCCQMAHFPVDWRA